MVSCLRSVNAKGLYKHYIGSSINLYERIRDHIKNQDSNVRLQRSIKKYGINSFILIIYYIQTDSNILLTDVETQVIKSFPKKSLFNFKMEATNLLGYKHTKKAISKMKLRFTNKENHPMFGKSHSAEALLRISKPGLLNPMFGKQHSLITKNKISLALSKRPIGLYSLDNKLIKVYMNQVELAKEYKVFKGTIGRYLRSGKIFEKKYLIKYIYNKS